MSDRPALPSTLPACPSCGYRRGSIAPAGYACPICSTPTDRSPTRRRPTSGLGGLVAGLLAFPQGLALFFGEPGIKRYLLPPLALATVVFTVAILWTRHVLAAFLDRNLASGDEEVALESLDPGWWRSTLEWLLNDAWGLELLRGGSWLLFALLATVLAWYCFSLVYELFAGPFLDEVHGIIEERWFGVDPRKDLDRPVDLPAADCARRSWVLGAVGAAVFAGLFWFLDWPWVLLSLLGFAAPFALAMTRGDDFARWLRWVVSVEGRAALIGVEMGIVSLAFSVFFVWLLLVPLVGQLAYAGAVGLGTAIGMLDLPLERRGWSLGQRLGLLARYPLPVMGFGMVTGMAFAVPIVGPMLAVPSASLGAMWLVCRLDTGTR